MKNAISNSFSTAINQTKHYFQPNTLSSTTINKQPTPKPTPPTTTATATKSEINKESSSSTSKKIKNKATTTTASSTKQTKPQTLNNVEPEADMETALLKLTHMLHSMDTNLSFVTNKTMTKEEIIKRSVNGPFRDDILNELGIVHFQQKNRTKALDLWREALLFNPASFRVHLNFAQTLYKGTNNITKDVLNKDRKEAAFVVKSLLQLRNSCEPHKQVGKSQKQQANAIPKYCAHLKEHKKDFQDTLFSGYQFMGTIKSHEEKPFEAETYYKQALKMKPWDQQIHILLAGVYENMSLFGQAKSYYKQCSKLGTSKGGGMIASQKKNKKNKKNKKKKKSKNEVVADAYEEMDRQNLGSICAKRSQQLDDRLKEWVKLKGDGGEEYIKRKGDWKNKGMP